MIPIIRKRLNTFSYFFDCGKRKTIHIKIKNVDNKTNGIDKPSTPRANLRLSLLNQEKEFTNWKCGIDLSKFIGKYSDKKKLLALVHNADFFDCTAFSSSSDEKKIKTSPIRGKTIKIGSIGRLIIKKYTNRY